MPLLNVPVPSVVVPSLNVTIPVTELGNVAVNVTALPYAEVVGDAVRVTVGDVLLTVTGEDDEPDAPA